MSELDDLKTEIRVLNDIYCQLGSRWADPHDVLVYIASRRRQIRRKIKKMSDKSSDKPPTGVGD